MPSGPEPSDRMPGSSPGAGDAVWCRRAEISVLLDGLPVALLEVSADGEIARANAAAHQLLGQDLVDRPLAAVVHPDDLDRVRGSFLTDQSGDGGQIEFRLPGPAPSRWVRAQHRSLHDSDDRISRVMSTWTDITDEVEARGTSARLGELLEAVEDVVAVAGVDGQVRYLNAAARALAGVEEPPGAGPGGLHLSDLFTPESAREIEAVALSTVRHFGSWTGEVTVIPLGMERRTLSLSLASHVDVDSGEESIFAMARDITELKRAEDAMRLQATTDGLTGLPNRTILFDRVNHALARASRHGGAVALLFVDLDRFKAVNDGMGHDAGDELLVQVAHRLGASVRDCDTVARIGGDEFVVLAEPVRQAADARVVGERIVVALAHPFALAAGTAHIGASVGLAMSAPGMTASELLKQADMAVYEAKSAGRSRVVAFDPVPG